MDLLTTTTRSSHGSPLRENSASRTYLRPNLIVFAVCPSGLGYATAGSDILSFTHVILGTGGQAYLGGLIEIIDFASAVLMMMFYRNIKQWLYHSIVVFAASSAGAHADG